MRLRKYLVCLLAAVMITGTAGINAHAAEAAEPAVTTDVETNSSQTTTEANGAMDAETGNASKTPAESTTEEEKKADTEAKKETSDQKKKDTTKKEEKKKSTTKKKKAASKKKPAAKKASTTKKTAPKYNSQDLRLLSALIYCEAGDEPYAGKVAVGIVVMNRKASSKFPGSVKSVIYQKHQFGPVRNGSLNRALSAYDKNKFNSSREKDSVKAAKAALSGTKKVTYRGKTINMAGFLYFSGRVSKPKLTIGSHQFR